MHSIAIIGIANLFPGSSTPAQFWQNLINARDSRSMLQDYRIEMKIDDYLGEKGDTDKFYCARGGYIENFAFDPDDFALPNEELLQLDESFQWSLYVAREALRDAGYLNQTQRPDCGIVLGNLSLPTIKSNHLFLPMYYNIVEEAIANVLGEPNFQLAKTASKPHGHNPHNADIGGYPARLIAKALNLGAVHFSIDAACATSLYSIKLACDYLNSGKTNLMLAGAVSGSDPFAVGMAFSTFQAYPENNHSAPLDKSSEGLFAGEGAGMLVLKRHSDAVKDGDNIYGIIQGCGLSNDGKGKFVLSPNPKGQLLAYERAYSDSGISPSTIDYIECHATGTMLGDKVEISTLEHFFGNPTNSEKSTEPFDTQSSNKPLLIGSVKSNVGHLLTAAGMAGIIKTLLSIQNGRIPATINIRTPLTSDNSAITAVQIPTQASPWPTENQHHMRRAGISAFGFGGCNAHLVIEQPREGQYREKLQANSSSEPETQTMAIVGMDAHFGQCEGLHAFSETSMSGKQHFVPLPERRWKGIEKETELLKQMGMESGQAPKGAYIEQFDMDFLHFKIPPNDNDQLIPQQLLLLKIADSAIQDAQLKPGSNVAVLVGMGLELEQHQFRGRVNLSAFIERGINQCKLDLTEDQRHKITEIAKDSLHGPTQINQQTSFIGNIMASRISSLWDFTGPSFIISEHENTAFRCLEIAQNLFLQSDIEAVVVAAVDLAGSAESVLTHNQISKLNGLKNSDKANHKDCSWMVGEGAGAIVLKRPEQSTTNQYGIIESVQFSKGNDRQAIAQACKQALHQASINPSQVSYVEISGSDTAKLDENELHALAEQYNKASTYIGSIKSSIGHTHTASGIAALIKTTLCMQHQMLPAAPDWSSSQHNSPFKIATQPHPWPQNSPYAAINSWSSAGSSAHLILSRGQLKREHPMKNVVQRQLIKTIKLGGPDIRQSILDCKEEFEQLPNSEVESQKPQATPPKHLDFLKSRLQSSEQFASLIKTQTSQVLKKSKHKEDKNLIPSE